MTTSTKFVQFIIPALTKYSTCSQLAKPLDYNVKERVHQSSHKDCQSKET